MKLGNLGAVTGCTVPVMVGGLLLCAGVMPAHAALSWQNVPHVLGTGGVTVVAATSKKRSKGNKVKQVAEPERTPSGETVANRERRLTRECKGRPNAGACAGYAN